MAELFPIDQIFYNAAYPALLANAFLDAGIGEIVTRIYQRCRGEIAAYRTDATSDPGNMLACLCPL